MAIELEKVPMKILFVDDELEILNSLQRLTRKLDESIYFISDPLEAIEIVYSENIDIVVSDLRMPLMDGITFLSKIAERCPETIRIMLTGNSDADMVLSAINKGRIWGFIEKPWQSDELLAVLQHAVNTRQLISMRSHQLYKELEQAKLMANAGVDTKNEFLAVMSHEIRTPLNAILGSLDLLADTNLDVKQSTLVHNTLSSGKALLSIVNNVLDYSKIQSGKLSLNIQKFHVLSTIDYLHEIFIETANAKNIALMFCISPNVSEQFFLDEQRLNQLLINLIGNAIKFTDNGGVELSIDASTSDLHFEIIDTGVGIENEDIASLFDEFVQVDSSYQRRYEGTGLGLAISKQLVELMGGKLSVSSKIGQGSTFKFSLPHSYFNQPLIAPENIVKRIVSLVNYDTFCERVLMKQLKLWHCEVNLIKDNRLKQQLHIHDIGEPFTNNKVKNMERISSNVDRLFVENYPCLLEKMFGKTVVQHLSDDIKLSLDKGNGEKILLVEDSLPNQLVAKTLLENANYNVDVASNGIEAIERVENNSYVLVLMDLSMPRMNGAQACKIIREKGGNFSSLPIWAMTANVAKRDIQHCLDVGMDDFIEKPINRKALLESISNLLRHTSENGVTNDKLVATYTSKSVAVACKTQIESTIVEQLIKDTGYAVFTNIIELFVKETMQRVSRIDYAYGEGDHLTIKNEAHAIKSSAATLGALELSRLALTLERDSHQDTLHQLEPMVTSLSSIANNTFEALRLHRENHGD